MAGLHLTTNGVRSVCGEDGSITSMIGATGCHICLGIALNRANADLASLRKGAQELMRDWKTAAVVAHTSEEDAATEAMVLDHCIRELRDLLQANEETR